MIHKEPHPLAGKTVRIKLTATHFQYSDFGGSELRVEDWWDRLSSTPWGTAKGKPACLVYAIRGAAQKPPLPLDDEVVYGKQGGFGSLVHVSELDV